MQLATSHKVRTFKQPAVKKQCQSQLKRANNRRLKVLYSSLEHSDSALDANTEFQESLWLNFNLQNGDHLLFGNVYRSPISSEENDGALNLVMGKMCSPGPGRFSHICVVGDYNFSRIRWSATHATSVESKEAKCIDIIEECYLYQHTNGPTRCRDDDMPSQLDLIFSK